MNKCEIKNGSSWKDQLKELRSEYRTVSRPCLAMSTDKFNKLMRKYKVIKPLWSYQKRKKYLQFIIDKSEERRVLSKSTIDSKLELGVLVHFKGGSPHVLECLDSTIDSLLDEMIVMDRL